MSEQVPKDVITQIYDPTNPVPTKQQEQLFKKVGKGLFEQAKEFFMYPSKVYEHGLDMEEAVKWGANTALGTVPGAIPLKAAVKAREATMQPVKFSQDDQIAIAVDAVSGIKVNSANWERMLAESPPGQIEDRRNETISTFEKKQDRLPLKGTQQ